MPGYEIHSASNPRIKRLARLRDRRHGVDEDVFMVEGPRLVDRAVAAGMTPIEVYLDGTVEYHGPGAIVTTHPEALARASYRRRSQGIIAVFPRFPTRLDDVSLSDPALVLVAEGIEKPGNLGAMLRTADAVGADAVVVADGSVDPFNANVVRASQGALFGVPLALSDLDAIVAWAIDRDLALVATSPSARRSLWDLDLRRSVAILVGSEEAGLSPRALASADDTVSIPMRGSGDSLNASVSLAVIAYEVLRQRD